MEPLDLYGHIRESVATHFSFLKDYAFTDFVESKLGHEMHLKANNGKVKIDIHFEETLATPIWATINDYSICLLEPNAAGVKDYELRFENDYDERFQQYCKTRDVIYLNAIADQYRASGRQLNDKYLGALSEILRRNESVLQGDMTLLQAGIEQNIHENEARVRAEKVKNKIYTLEYQSFMYDDIGFLYDAFEEFRSLVEIKTHLAKNKEIKVFRILDWNNNVISINEV